MSSYNPSWKMVLMSYHKFSLPWLICYYRKNNVKSVAYIMNAARPSVDENPDFIFNDAEKLREAGFVVDIVDLDKMDDVENHLKDYNSIYVRGGNTFCLLNSVHKSGLDKVLSKLLDKGKIYASSSAGSILPAPSIEIVENDFMTDEDIVGLDDRKGLGLVDFAIFPHWEDRFEKDLEDLKRKLDIKYPIYTLHDDELVLVENGSTKKIKVSEN